MKRLTVILIVSVVLLAVATLTYAQYAGPGRRLPQPQVLTGTDIAFRVEGTDVNNKPIGRWMVRFNGQWVDVGTGFTTLPAQ